MTFLQSHCTKANVSDDQGLIEIVVSWLAVTLITTEAGLIESAASASIVIRFFQKLNNIPMAKNASLD